jgi:hypothetical protein
LILWGQFLREVTRPGLKADEHHFTATGSWIAKYDGVTGKSDGVWKSATFTPLAVRQVPRTDYIVVAGYAHADSQRAFGKQAADHPGIADSIRLFDVNTLKPVRSFLPPADADAARWVVNEAVPSLDGRMVAVADNKGLIRLYETATGRIRNQYSGHGGSGVLQLAFTPEGRRLLSTGQDRTGLVWDVTAPQSPSPTTIDQAWLDLASADAAKAFAAERSLIDRPAESATFLKQHLSPAVSVDADHLTDLLTALDAPRFDDRERSTEYLTTVADQIGPHLRSALSQATRKEVRMRLLRILDSVDPSKPLSGDALRAVRAVEVLERLGTPAALELLKSLTKGAAPARLTVVAKQSLDGRTK